MLNEQIERPKVGVGVIIKKDGKVLLGKRKGSHGAGTWAFPGGHLEYGESPFDCVLREVKEEAGIEISSLKIGPYTNDVFEAEGKHYITLYVVADWKSGEPMILEPDKLDGWEWFAWDALPEDVFLPIKNLKMSSFNPFA